MFVLNVWFHLLIKTNILTVHPNLLYTHQFYKHQSILAMGNCVNLMLLLATFVEQTMNHVIQFLSVATNYIRVEQQAQNQGFHYFHQIRLILFQLI